MGKDLKGKELGKGITQRKDGRYQARFTDRFGKRRTVYGKTLKDIKNELHNEIVEDYRLNNTINPNTTLDEWFDKWIRIYKQNYVKEVTILRYKSMYKNHVQEFLGRKRVNEINRLMVVDLIGNLNKNNFKKSTINCISRMLYDIFECAMADDVCTKNPMLKIKKLYEPNKKGTALTLEQQIDFFNMSVNSYYNNLFITIVNTGMRFGEISALTIGDVDFYNCKISVNKTSVYYKSEGEQCSFHVTPPKTPSANRTIPMNNMCKKAIQDQITVLKKILKLNENDPLNKSQLIFTTHSGNQISRGCIYSAMKHVIDRVNVVRAANSKPPMAYFGPHTLRHTFATRCFDEGINPKIVQAYLGHKSVNTTLDIYTDINESQKTHNILMLEDAMNETIRRRAE